MGVEVGSQFLWQGGQESARGRPMMPGSQGPVWIHHLLISTLGGGHGPYLQSSVNDSTEAFASAVGRRGPMETCSLPQSPPEPAPRQAPATPSGAQNGSLAGG